MWRVCALCDPPHIENCERCFGFGVTPGTGSPVSASRAAALREASEWLGMVEPCPICRSLPDGVELNHTPHTIAV